MAPLVRKISDEEWKRHDDTIHNLYRVRGLPLRSEKGDPSVQQIMRDDHQFSASVSQYEAYFKKRDRPKNLKKGEWRAVHAKLNELYKRGIEYRVNLSGHVLSRQRLERSRRHAFSGLEQPHHNASDRLALPPRHRVAIEIRGADGEWSAYTGGNTVEDTHSSPPANNCTALEPGESSDLELISGNEVLSLSGFESPPRFLPLTTIGHAVLGPESSSPLVPIHEHRALSLSSHELAKFGSPLSSWNNSFHHMDFGPLTEMGIPWSSDPGSLQLSGPFSAALSGISAYETPFTSQSWAEKSPFSQFQAAFLAKPRYAINFQHQSPKYTGAGHEWDSVLSTKSPTSSRILVESLLQEATQVLNDNSMCHMVKELPDLDDVLDSLLSLLPESPAQDSSEERYELATRDSIFESPFYSALLFSIANGLVGLQSIPSGAILRMLRKEHQIGSRLFEYLYSCPPVLAKTLADNLFRAAVEAGDEQAVIVILQATRNSPNAIDPNEIVCKVNGYYRMYTPVELAAKFRHLGIVQTLLAANADVNKTYEQDHRLERGALELAIHKFGKYEALDMQLVQTLLDCHAEVRVDLVEAVIRWGQKDLLRELISRIPPASHRGWFENRSMMINIIWYLENSIATKIIKQLFDYCEAENCMRCSTDHQNVLRATLFYAIKEGNLQLIELLLCHVTRKDTALLAAIRYGNRELVDLLIEAGARLGGPTNHIDPYHADRYSPYAKDRYGTWHEFPTTPLAEAIRLPDKDLVQEFENLGALSYINQKGHFEAAIFAAAEIGDVPYMKMLLERVPEKRGSCLTPALTVAIQGDKTEAALILLDNGADVNKSRRFDEGHPPLQEALRKQNKAIVEEILEADIDVGPSKTLKCLELAMAWGEISIVEDLIIMGADINHELEKAALVVAVELKNMPLVELLLKYGASPSKCSGFGLSPLEAAIKNDDDEMIHFLISHGANPADDGAFSLAIEKNRGAFNTLIETFRATYPWGRRWFGGNLLIEAIKKEDTAMLDTMLKANFDVNAFSEKFGKQITAFGFAIMYKKGGDINLVQKLIETRGCDPNSIVRKPRLTFSESVWPLETALMVAVTTRCEQMVELLLRKGADVHRPARRGLKRTPLQAACEIGSFKMVKLLLDNGATVHEQPAIRGGATALQLAAISGSVKIAKLLLSYGAFVHAPPSKVNGRSAFEGAAEHGRLEMIKVLWDAVSGLGFTPKQIENAISLAKAGGHRGCAEYIAGLSSTANFALLQTDPFIAL